MITDSQGHVVRTMKGTHELEKDEKPPDEEDIPLAATATQVQQQPTPAKKAEAESAEPGQPKKHSLGADQTRAYSGSIGTCGLTVRCAG